MKLGFVWAIETDLVLYAGRIWLVFRVAINQLGCVGGRN